jgi:hypothetical protein
MFNKCKKRKAFHLIYFSILVVFGLGLCNMKANAADTDNISVEVTYGFNETVKTDSNTVLTISVTNNGSEINGKVQVLLSSVLNSNSTNQSMILSGSKEKNYMYEKPALIAANATTDITMIIPIMSRTNKLKIMIYDEYGDIVSINQKEIKSEYYYYYAFAAILTDDPAVLNYFENTALYQLNDYTFKAIILGKDDIPSENYSLELFDVMIADQRQLEGLTKEQKKVIQNWEKNGGFLIKINDNQAISWESIIPEEVLKKLDYSYRTYADWAITYALSNVFMNNLPKFTIYTAVLIIYILLMGPLLYILLKKLNKRKFFWICEICGSLLFTIVIITLGSSTRLNAPFINYFKIVSFRDNVIENSIYFNIRAPFNNEYKLYLDKEYSFSPIYETVYYEEEIKKAKMDHYNVGITYADKENTITIKNDVAFTKEYFYAEKTEEIKGTDLINVNMSMFGDKVYGNVVNNLDYPIENAAILVYNKVIFLNTIPANSTISLDNMKIYTYNPKFKYGLTNEIAGAKMDKNGVIKDGYMLQNQKKTIIDYYLEKNFGVYTEKAYLIGFTTDINQLELQLDSAYDAYGMTMIETPVYVDYTSGNQQYTTYVPIKNEEYSASGDIMYTDEMILTYSLGQNLNDINLYFNDLSYYDEEYYKAFSGHIYFYNRNTTLYDPVDLSKKSVSSEELKPYLNEQNEIVIKYVEHFEEEEKQALLPSLSTIGRLNDVKD